MPSPMFESDEILWYDNGRWGQAGYAIPNPAGKTFTNNSVIFQLHSLLGRTMFDMMHRPDVKFFGPPHKQFWFDLHQLIITARKRLADRTRQPNDSNGLDVTHVTPAPQVFLVYPVPFFGERIRQPDVREYCQLALMLQSEMMQHSDNERSTYVGPGFSAVCGKYLQEILALLSTKYFGKTRVQAYAPDFALVDSDFTGYDPAKFMTSVELSEERPPLQWWPTENELSLIRGLAINEALMFAKRWPATALLNTSNVSTVSSSGAPTGSGGQVQSSTAFVAPAGQAP
jgi:hypothetical protein